ncbi:uncharacterized protein LOC111089582 [Limulus polyphemus]|uniref:Uncharacterized protein LOC111089582 n=1 Tax=Limulus polyphemus TaxID=6850 RepID=A0ABM1TQA9_LIMPO|nr:uncharacterized protein LOC111089582 [Limulus polyphemus]
MRIAKTARTQTSNVAAETISKQVPRPVTTAQSVAWHSLNMQASQLHQTQHFSRSRGGLRRSFDLNKIITEIRHNVRPLQSVPRGHDPQSYVWRSTFIRRVKYETCAVNYYYFDLRNSDPETVEALIERRNHQREHPSLNNTLVMRHCRRTHSWFLFPC